MTIEKALNSLRQVKTVEEWNEARERIKTQIDPHTWVKHYVPLIDANGLIVEVLGKDGE